MRTLKHIGVPRTTPIDGETYSEGMKLHLTSPDASPNRIEWLRFDADSWMHPLIKNQTHLAYEVTDPKAEMEGKKILLQPTDCGEGNFIAFIEEEGIAIEIMWKQ